MPGFYYIFCKIGVARVAYLYLQKACINHLMLLQLLFEIGYYYSLACNGDITYIFEFENTLWIYLNLTLPLLLRK